MSTTASLKEYRERIAPTLMKHLNYKSSAMQVPRLTKIVINEGLGIASQTRKLLMS